MTMFEVRKTYLIFIFPKFTFSVFNVTLFFQYFIGLFFLVKGEATKMSNEKWTRYQKIVECKDI